MTTTTLFGSTEAQAARDLIGGTAIGDLRNDLLRQVLVATANKVSGGGGAAWGAITGTLSAQTDLQTALNAKLSLSGGTMTGDITTKAAGLIIPGVISGTVTVQAPAVAGTPTVTLPSVTGTLATTGNPLSQFASTTSAQLAGIISDETGAGALMFGTDPALTVSSPTTNSVGYLGIPQNSKSAAYTTVLTDAGKHLYHPGADTTARTWTIDSNANVPYPIGTAITFVNDTSAGVITIAITSDTLVLAGAGTTGSRTLAANGIATAVKITSTRWMISGTGLT
jgi:hypothetical protein